MKTSQIRKILRNNKTNKAHESWSKVAYYNAKIP